MSLQKLKKLRGRSFDELRDRGRQMLAARAERHGLSSLARVPSDAALFGLLDVPGAGGPGPPAEGLLDHFRRRTRPSFFASFAHRGATLAELRRRFGPRVEERTLGRARRITEGRFDLLGLRDLFFGDPPDWHLEPLSGKRAPFQHWSRIEYLNAEVAGDKKITWELNRHQYFATLGRAYWYTGDELYARTFAAHADGWMEHNPPKMGINWASSLEVAYRAISWLWALHFFKDSPHLTPQLFLRVMKTLYLHARHLETYLSTYFSPNTHLTGEALGLFYLGTLLPEFRRAARWRATGEAVLVAELDRHVRPDGVYFEQSSYYHRYTADIYTHLLVLLRANGERVADAVERKLAALLDHLLYITRPDGTTPLIGDDDGGRLVTLDERAPNDFRAALSNGAALFRRPDYKFVAAGAAEETLWLLGPSGLEAFDLTPARPPADDSRAFGDGGYYVMRDGWGRDADYLLLDCGPHGALAHGHAHADALAFELASRGRTLLVDPGTYTYTGSAELRDLFRGSAAHNTLTVDGESSSVPDGPFSWRHVARSTPRCWVAHDRFCFFEGEHDGYARLAPPAAHARGVLFLKNCYWVVRDRVATTGTHRYDLHFHFAPGSAPAIEAEDGRRAVRERAPGVPGLDLFVYGAAGEWRAETGWVSGSYRERVPAPVLVFMAEAEGAQEFFSFLIPREPGEAKARVAEIKAAGGRAFEVLDGATRDVLLFGGGGLATAAGMASDFGWAWVRLARETGAVEELVAVGGRHLSVGGREIFAASEYVSYVAARRAGDQLHVETDGIQGPRLAVAVGEFHAASIQL